jgi:hypothetical protein
MAASDVWRIKQLNSYYEVNISILNSVLGTAKIPDDLDQIDRWLS